MYPRNIAAIGSRTSCPPEPGCCNGADTGCTGVAEVVLLATSAAFFFER
jgi:hypothetical protein